MFCSLSVSVEEGYNELLVSYSKLKHLTAAFSLGFTVYLCFCFCVWLQLVVQVHLCLLQSQGASPPPPVATWCSNRHHPPLGHVGHFGPLGHLGQIANVQIVNGVEELADIGNNKIIIFNKQHLGVTLALGDTASFLRNEYFVWMNILLFFKWISF